LDIKGSPPIVEVFKDLKWCDVTISREVMLELAVILFVKGVA
jgi:hypothetical protein